jgi:hypothetical protein
MVVNNNKEDILALMFTSHGCLLITAGGIK